MHPRAAGAAGAILWVAATATVRGDTHFVDAASASPVAPYLDWTTAATGIQDAVSIATNGSMVLVTDGTYQVDAPIVVSNGVVLQSVNGPSNTFVTGNGQTNCIQLTGSNAVLSGFTIQGGKARFGGGVYAGDVPVLISHCVIRGNRADYGGGLYFDRSAPWVSACVIESNVANNLSGTAGINWPETAGGGVFLRDASGTLEDCIIRNNAASNAAEGGGITFFHPEQTFDGNTSPVAVAFMRDCLVASNTCDYTGGGIAFTGANLDSPITRYHIDVSNCVFDGNSGQYGGGYYHAYWGTMPTLWNCLFIRNRSQSNGGAIRVFDTIYYGNFSYYARSTFVNTTIVDNHATNNYAVYVSYSVMYMLNSIIWSNLDLGSLRVDTDPFPGNYQEVEYTDLEGGYNGVGIGQAGNIDEDPLFVDFAAGDVHLLSNSPCVDSAYGLAQLPEDLDHVGRPLDGNNNGFSTTDRGAYEFVHPFADSDKDRLVDTNELALGTNPARADTDHDRMNDGDEVLAETDPLDVLSYLGVESITFTGAFPRITWTTVYGREYRLQRTTQPAGNAWSNVLSKFELDEFPEGTESALDPSPPPGAKLYRVEIVP